jgi:hypothetical protein
MHESVDPGNASNGYSIVVLCLYRKIQYLERCTCSSRISCPSDTTTLYRKMQFTRLLTFVQYQLIIIKRNTLFKCRLCIALPAFLRAGDEGHDSETVLLAQYTFSLGLVHLTE